MKLMHTEKSQNIQINHKDESLASLLATKIYKCKFLVFNSNNQKMSNYAQRLAKYKKQDNSTYWQGYEQKVFLSTLENVLVVPNKVEYAGTSKSLHSLGIYYYEMFVCINPKHWEMFTQFFSISKQCKQQWKISIKSRVDKQWYTHMIEYYIAMKRNE